jgi:hypothetical protein
MIKAVNQKADEVGDFGSGGDFESSVEKSSDPSERATAIQEPKKAIASKSSAGTAQKTEFELPDADS